MGEIIISNPPISSDFFRNHTGESRWDQKQLQRNIALGGISPNEFPRIADFCSGNLYAAKVFVDNGWNPQDVTGVDIKIPDAAAVSEAQMKYWDLVVLSKVINKHQMIPYDVVKYKESFYLIILSVPGVVTHVSELLRYFLRIGGVTYVTPSTLAFRVQADAKHWKQVIYTKSFFQKIA